MSSIFDLKTSVDELSSANQGMSRMQYEQHAPTRDVTGNNFANGAIHIRFQTSGSKWWNPSRSYMRMRCRLTKADGTQLDRGDGIAPNMGLCASLFQSAEFRINDKTISRISDFMPQVDALDTRLTKSRSWLNGVGSAVNFWDDSFKVRQSAVASDGVLVRELVEDTLSAPTSALYDRADLGFDDADPAGNTAAYTASTAQVVFAPGTGASPLPTLTTAYPIGSYFQFTKIDGVAPGVLDPRLKKPAKVTGHVNATTLQLESGVILTDVAASGDNEWVRSDIKAVAAANVDIARKVAEFELIWIPPLSIFKILHSIPSCKAELVLNPQTSSVYQKYAIQALTSGPDKVPNTATTGSPSAGSDYLFNVQDMYFYCNTVEGPRADDITYLLDLEQINCQSEQFSANQQSFQQRNFDVSPSTTALTVAYQDSRAGTDARHSSSIFKVSNTARTANDEELNLNRFYINYSGQNLPAPDADPDFTPLIDYTTQRYAESQIYSGAMFDTGGAESLSEYHSRGAYLHFAWARDGTDRSTRVTVNNQFKQSTDTSNMRMLLFSHSKQVARISVQDGRVTDVQLEDA